MVINATTVIPSSAMGDLVTGLMSLPGVTDILMIIKAIGILVALYVVFLIIRGITQISMASRLKVIALNVEEMNRKMDLIISKKGSKKEKK